MAAEEIHVLCRCRAAVTGARWPISPPVAAAWAECNAMRSSLLDFTEPSEHGIDLELLIREIPATRRFDVRWSGVGPNEARHLVCVERRDIHLLQGQIEVDLHRDDEEKASM